MIPAFRITADDDDVTDAIAGRLIELRLTMSADGDSDTLDLTLDGDRLAAPRHGASLAVQLGYQGAPLAPMGVYLHAETEIELRPRIVRLRAAAADFRRTSTLKEPRTRSWEATTIGDLLRTVAAEHGYLGVAEPALGAAEIIHLDQTAESDLHLLRRLARLYGATVKAAAGRLVFVERAARRSAGTARLLPEIPIRPGDATTARVTRHDRARYRAVRASWHDHRSATLRHIVIGHGKPVFEIREPRANEATARADAEARLKRLTRATATLDLAIPGNPYAVAEARIVMTGWGDDADGAWSILRASHTLSARNGFRTDLQAEPGNA